MKITKRDVGRAVIFQGFDGELYKGYIESRGTSEYGFEYIQVAYRLPLQGYELTATLGKAHWDRVAFVA